jgi:enoyl-CoA hydratase
MRAMSEAPHLLVERADGVLVVTMNRPEARNALSPEMLVRMAEAWRSFRDAKDLHVAILTGAGDASFCAGGDLKLTMPLVTGARQPETEWDRRLLADMTQFTDAVLRGFELYKPVIAAVNGSALGGGTEMAAACDLRVAADHAVFGTPEAKVGLLPGGGSLTRLPRQVPWALAMELLLVGDPIDAQRAQAIGLVNYVVPRAQLLDKARELAAKIAANGPLAVRKIKEGVVRASGRPIAEALQIENEVSAVVLSSRDAREGPRAFKEKRKPQFTGE